MPKFGGTLREYPTFKADWITQVVPSYDEKAQLYELRGLVPEKVRVDVEKFTTIAPFRIMYLILNPPRPIILATVPVYLGLEGDRRLAVLWPVTPPVSSGGPVPKISSPTNFFTTSLSPPPRPSST